MMIAKKIVVKGIVQGVGFRPFIYKNATKNNLKGFVNNTSKGVFVEVEGYEEDITSFIKEIREKPPVLSKITDIKIIDKEIEGYTDFKIIESVEEEEAITLLSPDIATCDDCLRDISDVNNRRYRYPFTNCTNCGPRFSITKKVPYDRGNTTMDVFQMCSAFHDEPFSYLKRNQACILTDDEEMKQVIFSGSFFDKVLVAESKWVGVHDKGSNFFWWICISICCSLV